MFIHYFILATLLFIAGCAPIQTVTVQYSYELSVIDVAGNPLEGVNIEYALKEKDQIIEKNSSTTSSDGLFTMTFEGISYQESSLLGSGYLAPYIATIDLKATKDGYYPWSKNITFSHGSKYFIDEDDKVKKRKSLLFDQLII